MLKALMFVKREIVPGYNSSWENWKYHCYKKLAESDDDLEVGIFFLEGTLQGEV